MARTSPDKTRSETESRPDRPARQGHASLDLAARNLKAAKIERLLDLEHRSGPLRILEIGTGSGGIASYFATHPILDCHVDAVDVEDTRQIRDQYRFRLIEGTALPFSEASFDLVISNHVIEHVGDEDSQIDHLREVRRVLKPDGVGYLAQPNRWQWIEPHYKLAGLSWLPERSRTAYLRLRRRGHHYDCRPLSAGRLETLLEKAGFEFEQQHRRALLLTFEIERPDSLAYRWVFKRLPTWTYRLLRRLFPTLIYVLRPDLPKQSSSR